MEVGSDSSVFTLVNGDAKTIHVYDEAYELENTLTIPRKKVGA